MNCGSGRLRKSWCFISIKHDCINRSEIEGCARKGVKQSEIQTQILPWAKQQDRKDICSFQKVEEISFLHFFQFFKIESNTEWKFFYLTIVQNIDASLSAAFAMPSSLLKHNLNDNLSPCYRSFSCSWTSSIFRSNLLIWHLKMAEINVLLCCKNNWKAKSWTW